MVHIHTHTLWKYFNCEHNLKCCGFSVHRFYYIAMDEIHEITKERYMHRINRTCKNKDDNRDNKNSCIQSQTILFYQAHTHTHTCFISNNHIFCSLNTFIILNNFDGVYVSLVVIVIWKKRDEIPYIHTHNKPQTDSNTFYWLQMCGCVCIILYTAHMWDRTQIMH